MGHLADWRLTSRDVIRREICRQNMTLNFSNSQLQVSVVNCTYIYLLYITISFTMSTSFLKEFSQFSCRDWLLWLTAQMLSRFCLSGAKFSTGLTLCHILIGPKAKEAICQICEESGDMLQCDGVCQSSFHLNCIGVTVAPSGPWKCDQCLSGE